MKAALMCEPSLSHADRLRYFRHGVRQLGRMRKISLVLLLFCGTHVLHAQDVVRYSVSRSEVIFVSDAPLERISASNSRSTGLIDIGARTFAVQIPILDFQGFNAPLQREHFNENYLETRTWPYASFQGRIIESIDLTIPGSHQVRAKGAFTIHGVEQERIVPCRIVVSEQGIRVTADLHVTLEDHKIRIPRVVQQKIAAVVQVKVDVLFTPGVIKP
jgi:hypothetical protein